MNGAAPTNPWEPLGLPREWQPIPLSWHLARLQAQTTDGPRTLHVIIIDSANGKQAYSFNADELRNLRDAITQQLSGLHLAGEHDLPKP